MRIAVMIAALGLLAACAGLGGDDGRPPPATVEQVDLVRYQGTWHEIARVPNRFQRRCVGDTNATYWPADDEGDIVVLNACALSGGAAEVAEGRARAVDDSGARLEVTFVNLFDRWTWRFSGDYWILALDPDYRWVLVGHPGRRFGWVLARTPALDMATLALIEGHIRAAGYDSCDFLTTPQRRGLGDERPLCEVVAQGA